MVRVRVETWHSIVVLDTMSQPTDFGFKMDKF